MVDDLEKIREEGLRQIEVGETAADLEDIRVQYLGRKGKITVILREIGKLSAEERPIVGKRANEIKKELEAVLAEKISSASHREREDRIASRSIDVTLPGRCPTRGHMHPISIVMDELVDLFVSMGYDVASGPEVETDYYNFESLNIPKDHPARDQQDTFYITEETLLRTHTSPVQTRYMEIHKPPFKMIAPGKVYRRDDDLTHSPMFFQLEGLVVGKDISFSHLKGTLEAAIHRIFPEKTAVRFRPDFFPFTEPSADVSIQCIGCGGSGCRICSGSGWLEILGAGSVDPAVFQSVGYDPEEVTGFAFGMGIERIAMLKYGIDDIRLFYQNDMRFLSQFG